MNQQMSKSWRQNALAAKPCHSVPLLKYKLNKKWMCEQILNYMYTCNIVVADLVRLGICVLKKGIARLTLAVNFAQ